MFNKKIKVTIEMNEDVYKRITDLVNYRNLWKKFELLDEDIYTNEEFINGCIIERLKKIEVFTMPKTNKKLLLSNDKTIKNSIKKYLYDNDIKQIDLAQILEIDKSNLSMYLNNRHQPPIDLFIKIWCALDYPPIEELLYREIDDEN